MDHRRRTYAANQTLVSANYCQVGSNLLVYKLKVCRDPEMCVRSIL